MAKPGMLGKVEDVFKDPDKAESLYALWPDWFEGISNSMDLNNLAIAGTLKEQQFFKDFIK